MIRVLVAALVLAVVSAGAMAAGDPIEERHEMMENVKDGAATIGGMIKGEKEFDAEAAMAALMVWQNAAEGFGALFPEGTYTGDPDTARDTVWSDREGFDKLLTEFGEKVNMAIAANPQSPEELGAAAGPVFKNCKSCHEGYRLEGD